MEKYIVFPDDNLDISIDIAESGEYPIVIYDNVNDEIVGVCMYEEGQGIWVYQIGTIYDCNDSLEEIIKSRSAYTFKAIVL